MESQGPDLAQMEVLGGSRVVWGGGVMLTRLLCILWGYRWSSPKPGFMRRPWIFCCMRPRMVGDLTMHSWRPQAGLLGAPTIWTKTRSESGNGLSAYGGSMSSGLTTVPTSTSEKASGPEPSSRPPPCSTLRSYAASRAPSTSPGVWRCFCNKPDDYFDISRQGELISTQVNAPLLLTSCAQGLYFPWGSEKPWCQACWVLEGKVWMGMMRTWELLFAVFIFVDVDYLFELLGWHSLWGSVWQLWEGSCSWWPPKCLWAPCFITPAKHAGFGSWALDWAFSRQGFARSPFCNRISHLELTGK